jgi:class 3 adenylate cyclase
MAHRLARRPTEAVALAGRGLQISAQFGLRKELQDNENELYRAYADLGNKAAAYDHLYKYLALRDSATGAVASGIVGTTMLRSQMDREARADSLLRAERDLRKEEQHHAELVRQRTERNIFLFVGLGLLVVAAIILRQRNKINKARKRSDELLLNILPEEVAEELKTKGTADAVQIDQVTVLFTDFKGFTAMSEVLTPKELVRDLHECFSAFDHICEKHGLEKIKTIGDAYMAAGGLPTPNTTHATDVIMAAFEMRDFIAEGKARKIAAGLPYFEIRIGVHTGPVVAGIVGVKKFQYDIWGDTVNTASRMESCGEVGQVNISEATFALVKGVAGLSFAPRGKVQAKGKGKMEMYFADRST